MVATGGSIGPEETSTGGRWNTNRFYALRDLQISPGVLDEGLLPDTRKANFILQGFARKIPSWPDGEILEFNLSVRIFVVSLN